MIHVPPDMPCHQANVLNFFRNRRSAAHRSSRADPLIHFHQTATSPAYTDSPSRSSQNPLIYETLQTARSTASYIFSPPNRSWAAALHNKFRNTTLRCTQDSHSDTARDT